MAARNGQNLLEEALRIAQATSRSHPARLTCLLRLATSAFGLSSATIYVPGSNSDLLTQRYSTLLPLSARSCQIPYGEGCVGSAAVSLEQTALSCDRLHRDEACAEGEQESLALPILDGKQLAAVLCVAAAQGPVPQATLPGLRPLLPLFAMVVTGLVAAQSAELSRRNLALITELGKLLNAPLPPGQLLPRLLRLCTGSGLAVCAIIRLSAVERGKPRLFRSCLRKDHDQLPEMLRSEQQLSARALAGESTCSAPPEASGATYHALSTPLGCNGRTLGTITFFNGPDLLSPEESEFAETLARLLSSALAEAISSERISSFVLENDKKLKELSLLYRMSNTMLSTIKLNKLIHLTLTALTSGPTPFFDRAMLFLTNERSGVLLGMLGVTSENSPPLATPRNSGNDILSSRWDISEADMAAQRESEFSRQVQGKRLELDATLNIASQAVLEKRLIYIPGEAESSDELHPGHCTAFAASPLIAHGQAVGAVMVDNALTRAAITQEDLRFLQLFANQAGMAIENSILYNKIEDANRQLCEAQESLLQKERLAAIGEMAAGIAHELKGPLVSIGGFANRLTRKLPRDSSEWGHADLIVREVLRLEAILSEILFFSKKAAICYAPCNLADIVKDSLAVVTPPLEEKQIALSTRFSRSKLLMMMGDGQQLKQVFINIILNAIDAMSSGGKLVVQAAPDEMDGKEAICVKISDTGGGIPIEAMGSIFTPFYTTKENGTGLGLPIANRIITNHGGKIQIVNKPGHGVEFRVILPKHL